MSSKESYWRIVWHHFKKDRLAMTGLFFVFLLFLVAIFSPFIAGNKPIVMKWGDKIYFPAVHSSVEMKNIDYKKLAGEDPNIFAIFPPIPYSPNEYNLNELLDAPSSKHLLGTDDQGRDVASQLIHGSRISLTIGFVAVSIYVIIGIILGALAGYYGGWIDILISRIIEIMMCFPTFFLILAVLAFVGPSIYNIMIVIGVTSWTGVARLIRGEFLKLRSQEFVVASEASGAKDRRVIFRHILPNSLAPVLVSATFGVASAILVESGLSFLGFGVPPYVPSWGGLLSQSRDFLDIAWWLTLSPGFAIFITITAYNLVGEGLRDAIDPRLRM